MYRGLSQGMYIGPSKHLQRKYLLFKPGPKGFLKVQFDDIGLSYGGVSLYWNWHLINEKHVKEV